MRRRTRAWHWWVAQGVRLEPVDAHAVCVSGTVVLALLRLGVPLSEQAEAVGVGVERLRATCAPGQRRRTLGAEVLAPVEVERLVALLGVEVAQGEARERAAACAWGVGVGARVPGALGAGTSGWGALEAGAWGPPHHGGGE